MCAGGAHKPLLCVICLCGCFVLFAQARLRAEHVRGNDSRMDALEVLADEYERAAGVAAKHARQLKSEQHKSEQLMLNRRLASEQREKSTVRCRRALSEAEQARRRAGEQTRQDAAERHDRMQQQEEERMGRAREVRRATHLSRSTAQRVKEERHHQRQLAVLDAERQAAESIKEARRATAEHKRQSRDRIFHDRYASATQADALEHSPFFNFWLMDDVAVATIQSANRQLLERLDDAQPRTDDRIDEDATAEARALAAAAAHERRRAETARIQRENELMRQRLQQATTTLRTGDGGGSGHGGSSGSLGGPSVLEAAGIFSAVLRASLGESNADVKL